MKATSLRLFTSGSRAIEQRLRELFTELRVDVDLEVIDVADAPELAEQYQIIALPVLERTRPEPVLRVVGFQGDYEGALQVLGVLNPIPGNGDGGNQCG